MIRTSELKALLKEHDITLEFFPLPRPFLGHHYGFGEYKFILLDESLKYKEPEYRSVLAEELSHFFKTPGDYTPKKMKRKDRLRITRGDNMALSWSTDFLIPTESLIDIFRNKYPITLPDLENYLCVTNWFLLKKFEFMSKQKSVWEIDNKIKVCLNNYPLIYIYKKLK